MSSFATSLFWKGEQNELGSGCGQMETAEGLGQRGWGKLTDDDLDTIAGEQDQLVGKIQERYGITREQAQSGIELWWNSQQPTSEAPETDKRRIA